MHDLTLSRILCTIIGPGCGNIVQAMIRTTSTVRRCVAAIAACLLVASCGSSDTSATTDAPDTVVQSDTVGVPDRSVSTASAPSSRVGGPVTIAVPADQKTVQGAIDASVPGDLILISPGTYSEEVIVRTPNIVIRGLDRNTVVFDGKDELVNGFQVSADGVAIENLTVRRYQVNGVVFTKAYDAPDPTQAEVLRGYRASYVTVANNGLYGLYAFYASGGQFDHVYGSGHPDGGIYIGQCKPCNAMVTNAVMERNGIGYSGTNSSGGLFLVNSTYRHNRIGMTPNSQTMEKLSPQGDVVIAGNLVEDNDDPETPPAASGAFGIGIAVGGGERNTIVRNRVRGHDTLGIAITTLNEFQPSGNRVEDNVLSDNATDLGFYATAAASLESKQNCFVGNQFSTSSPASIESVLACDAQSSIVGTDGSAFVRPGPPPFDYRKIPLPSDQDNMPNAATAPAQPASAAVPSIDLASIKVPS